MQRDTDIIQEEQIEKMAKDFCRVPCVCQKSRTNCDKLCEIYIFARRVYNAGFRKATDVRKETAKEILNDLYYNLQVSVQEKISKSNDYYNVDGWIKEIAKEYGVEVEE